MNNEITLKEVYTKLIRLEEKVDVIELTKLKTLKEIHKYMWLLVVISLVTLGIHIFFLL